MQWCHRKVNGKREWTLSERTYGTDFLKCSEGSLDRVDTFCYTGDLIISGRGCFENTGCRIFIELLLLLVTNGFLFSEWQTIVLVYEH